MLNLNNVHFKTTINILNFQNYSINPINNQYCWSEGLLFSVFSFQIVMFNCDHLLYKSSYLHRMYVISIYHACIYGKLIRGERETYYHAGYSWKMEAHIHSFIHMLHEREGQIARRVVETWVTCTQVILPNVSIWNLFNYWTTLFFFVNKLLQ